MKIILAVMESIEVKVARDYRRIPGPRYIKEGENSGELFRQTVLYPAFKKALEEGKKLIVDLDGTSGYGTSFLEESFGGLIREEKMSFETIMANLKLISEEEDYLIEDIHHYINDAERDRKNKIEQQKNN